MPYYDILAAADSNEEVDLDQCVAFAPDEQFEAFSYGSEHLGHDGAIASLLSCAAALRACAQVIETDVSGALAWIDREVARLWTARGVHPGLGSVLAAFGLEHGALLAHEIVHAGSREGAYSTLLSSSMALPRRQRSSPWRRRSASEPPTVRRG